MIERGDMMSIEVKITAYAYITFNFLKRGNVPRLHGGGEASMYRRPAYEMMTRLNNRYVFEESANSREM